MTGTQNEGRQRVISLAVFVFMELKQNTIKELKEIMTADYGVSLDDEKLLSLGTSLLRLTRLATAALARADEKIARSGKGGDSLEPKTSKE